MTGKCCDEGKSFLSEVLLVKQEIKLFTKKLKKQFLSINDSIETEEKTFPAYAFEVCNDSGIAKASKEDIHRTLLYRWEHGTDHEREDPRVKKAHKIQTVFDECEIDLEGQRIRKSDKLKGEKDHFFSHFQYAHFGFDEAKGQELKKILNAIKTVYNSYSIFIW